MTELIFVFLGPTLTLEEASLYLDAEYLPPVSQGDVYRVARQNPFAIGIIDGYFDQVPAVWHKEILWALCHGIHVFGAASMGALRAAELDRFGMRGVGKIYNMYASGELTDDDEVALAHAPAASGFRCASEALVNIRFTLELAEREGLISNDTLLALTQLAKNEYYPERSYPRLLRSARAAGVSHAELSELGVFLETARIDQKKADAIEMLVALAETLQSREPMPEVKYRLSHTEAWDAAIQELDALPPLRGVRR